MPNQNQKFYGNYLRWDVERSTNTFRVFVVEPDIYDPARHIAVFDAALIALTAVSVESLDQTRPFKTVEPPEPFDLVTFPEAFLPASHLVSILAVLAVESPFGCVHVGLRPDTGENHLFSVVQVHELVKCIRDLGRVELDDLAPFTTWLDMQGQGLWFNVGCLFTMDSAGKIRICLHPKLVRSKFEVSALPEGHMAEANLLSLVTLYPSNKAFKTVTLQPLLCSDVLENPTDARNGGPLIGVNVDAGFVSPHPPDHIDIVSVATCTRQFARPSATKGRINYSWHPEFKNTLQRVARREALSRHHFSTFILSNFHTVLDDDPGGLSGVFIPVPLRKLAYQKFVIITCWGHPENDRSEKWSPEDEGYETAKTWKSRGYLAYLDRHPENPADPTGRMFGFSVVPLPREAPPWGDAPAIIGCREVFAITEDKGATMKFGGD